MKVIKTFNVSLAFTKKVKCSQTEITIKTGVKWKVLSLEYLQGLVRRYCICIQQEQIVCHLFNFILRLAKELCRQKMNCIPVL